MSDPMEPDERISSFAPICDQKSRLLILGTMPSPASLRAGMYYSHPQNAFWRLLSDLTGDFPGQTNEEKRRFLLAQGIALWDTLRCCVRPGALDSSIRQEQPNGVAALRAGCPLLQAVFLNGGAALRYYQRYHSQAIGLPFFVLPSSSPANARGGYARKLEGWRQILGPYLERNSGPGSDCTPSTDII